mmetsp:Transcript_662/g.989  ORF Transcript_662/g.989 Transcript_662/m.989 type:complete len:200 (+) Transcript_662:158-757(+)
MQGPPHHYCMDVYSISAGGCVRATGQLNSSRAGSAHAVNLLLCPRLPSGPHRLPDPHRLALVDPVDSVDGLLRLVVAAVVQLPGRCRRRLHRGAALHDARHGCASLRHKVLQVAEVVLDPVQVVRHQVRRLAVGARDDHSALCVRLSADGVCVARLAQVAGELQLKSVPLRLRLLLASRAADRRHGPVADFQPRHLLLV